MANIEQNETSPGLELRNLLKKLYPFDPLKKRSFVSKIDAALIAEGEFSQLVYDSCIYYMVRRLITTAQYLNRQYGTSDHPPGRFVVELRKFVRDYTNIPKDKIELALTLLLECVNVANRKPGKGTKRRILRYTRERGLRCYICGCELDFDNPESPQRPVVEHVWPNSMGGLNSEPNLKVSCWSCNQHKADYVDASDFHYEEICLASNKETASFPKDLKGVYRVAIWAKSGYKCAECEKPASRLGELAFARRDLDDSWHFLNIDVYCSRHTPKDQ